MDTVGVILLNPSIQSLVSLYYVGLGVVDATNSTHFPSTSSLNYTTLANVPDPNNAEFVVQLLPDNF